MSAPRGLSAEEAAAWERVAATVKPLRAPRLSRPDPAKVAAIRETPAPAAAAAPPAPRVAPPRAAPAAAPAAGRRGAAAPAAGLDSHWDRRFARGAIEPDFTLDLHGHTLETAHARLDAGLAQAKALGARVILLIAGKPRPAAAADRASSRGAIRAKLLDWLAAGPHGADVAAVRKAHRRHGGEGALYLVLRRRG